MWWRDIQYDRLEWLGEGGQGQVFKALRRDRKTQMCQIVALKILHSETLVDLWRREFESLSKVNSPGCVQVLAFDRVDGKPALILEYVDGCSLTHLCQDVELTYGEVDEILAQIERALKDLKDSGLFHGDLSPANILVDRNGYIKLLDFGLANFGGQTPRLTPEFASPERLAGAEPDYSSDLFSLGKIEVFLRGNYAARKTAENYLHPDPKKRTTRNLVSDSALKDSLATKIKFCCDTRDMKRGGPTKTLGSEAPPRKIYSGLLVVALMTGLLTSSSHALSKGPPFAWATLIIRTLKWHQIYIDGKAQGYAPLSITIPSEKRVQLGFMSPDGGGRKVLRLKPGERMVIHDDFFTQLVRGPNVKYRGSNSSLGSLGR